MRYAIAATYGRTFSSASQLLPAVGSMLCSAMVLLPFSVMLERPWLLAPSIESILCTIALGVISTALALVIYFRLLSTLGAVASSSASYLRAAVSVLLGYWFLGEQPSFWILLGLALVIAGVAAMAYQRD